MLTDNQNKIIEDIKNEFSKMNTQPISNAGGLINRALMDKNIDASIKRRAELNLITDATFKSIREKIDHDIYRLNKELNDMGIAMRRHPDNEWIVQADDLSPYDKMWITYTKSHKYETFPDHTGVTYYTGLSHIEFKGNKFNSIDDICKTDKFINYIQEMYRKIKTENK